MPQRIEFEMRNGRMAGLVWGDQTRPPDILFLHATGFNAMTYRTVLAPLGERFHVVAVDLRGHGRTTLPAQIFGYSSWNRHREDVIELIGQHIKAPVTLAGHSMGAIVALLVGGKRPDLARGLALLEPVLAPPSVYTRAVLPGSPLLMRYTLPIARGAARRRSRFASREEAVDAFTGRGIFRTFSREQITDYVTDGLVEEEGGVRLACTPAFESRTFSAQRHDPWRAVVKAPTPLICLRAEKGSTMHKSSVGRLSALRPDARIAQIDGASHMMPLERPDRARAAIEMAAMIGAPANRYRDLV